MKLKDYIVFLFLIPIILSVIIFSGNVAAYMFFEPFLTEDIGARLWIGSLFFFIMFCAAGYIAYEVCEKWKN